MGISFYLNSWLNQSNERYHGGHLHGLYEVRCQRHAEIHMIYVNEACWWLISLVGGGGGGGISGIMISLIANFCSAFESRTNPKTSWSKFFNVIMKITLVSQLHLRPSVLAGIIVGSLYICSALLIFRGHFSPNNSRDTYDDFFIKVTGKHLELSITNKLRQPQKLNRR